ncbi:adenylate/guanylate cyclase domain-containing protein [Bradyrhizobium sp. sBnM-33]|uniref:adenylate/guanylate cyclase domain-containing protein n=1 Tax=Bradyrhizobium sp. sBnM-33 TaxID=2831780 RepID=UPI0020C13656|nr:adenylate/guanylate cyclase domain-containing protein [Bradyrhizobium sp. sBnM-33]WOH54836.1 adenylate/guanylate cyclase domain-containing protein [Bradyrhizobium sp. sBnM-33]
MQPIAHWLNALGLGQYAQRFADNDIDASILRDLTDEDLEKIGVSLGHRKKILRAIAVLDEVGRAPESPRWDEAERRQLTVMFADLVGSTALSTRLDPEDLRKIIGAYQRRCAEVIAKSGGFVARYMGDGILAYFGYPQAHEEDAERAVRAGLELVEAVAKLDDGAGAALHVRVGVATGLVVVGDLRSEGAAQEHEVVGETPNLAARLQTLAEPDAVVISESTRCLLGELFENRALGTVSVKGFGAPVPVWQVTGASAVESRFEALRRGSGETPLVGREEEIELLLRRWQQAKRGDGCVVLISGEAGIGKSRIAQTVLARLSGKPHIRLRYFCSPHHQDTALYPTISRLERAAGFRREDTTEERLDKLEALLAQATNDVSEAAPLIADLLSIPTGGRYQALDLTPQKRKGKTFEALIAQVEGLAARQPLLMMFDDVHWSDPTTRELLDLLIDRVPTLRVLVIITLRPEFTPPWVGRSHVTLLSLSRLAPRQSAEMMMRVTGGKALPKEITEQIIDRTDGVPLFIEELTKSVVESGLVTKSGDGYTVTGPAVPLAIPTTLHASLLARLDRLAPVREVAQIGAALGRHFSHELISAVAAMPQPQLEDAMAQLVRAELIFRRGTPPDAEYTFKHALVQDAAYSTLLRGRRQALQARIAATLERQFPEIVAVRPALLARHCAEAGLSEKAINYWRTAGEQAVHRASNREAIGHFHQALALNEKQLPGVERSRTELAILSQLGPALMSVHGRAAAEVGAVFERAGEVARQLESSVELAPPLAGLWLFHLTRGQFARAEEIVDELFNVARNLDNRDILLQAHHAAWSTGLFRGMFTDARTHVDAGLALYDEARHAEHRFLYLDHDPAVCALSMGALLRWLLGYPNQGIHEEHDAITLARRLQHAPSLANTLSYVGFAQIARGDTAAATATASELLALSGEYGLPQMRGIALMCLGWNMGQTKDVGEGLRYLEQGLAERIQLGLRTLLPFSIGLLAETHLKAQRYAEGIEQVNLALAASYEIGEQWFLPRIHMLRAQLLQQQACPNVDAAEASLRMAIDVAQAQCAKGWELRATTLLARLWCDQSKRTEARDLLAPIYGWFTEGFDTPDLKEAKALLELLTE